MRFTRIQFTPDLMPVGRHRLVDLEPARRRLRVPARARSSRTCSSADEINRAPPKTQAALLEAMQERQVTIEGETHPARPAVPRHRHAEPDRVRGHVPAARGAARPLPAPHRVRLPAADGRGRRARPPDRARTDEIELQPMRRPRDARSRCRRRSSTCTSRTACGPTASTSSLRPASRRASSSGRAPRQPRAAEARTLQGRARGAGLRAAGRREDGRGGGARTPARPPSRALGAEDHGGGRRPRESSTTVPTPKAEDVAAAR